MRDSSIPSPDNETKKSVTFATTNGDRVDIVPEEDLELRQIYTRMASVVDDSPFHETSYQPIKQDLSYKADFRGEDFLLFFFYHLIYYMLLGPLIIIFFIHNQVYFKNLGFWSWELESLHQIGLWLGQLSCSFIYIYTDYISALQISLLYFSIVLRSFIAGAKYATMCEDRLEMYKTQRLSRQATKFDIVLFDWAYQSQKITLLEILKAIRRHDFDTTYFNFQFLVEPSKETQQQLDRYETDESKITGIQIMQFLINQFQNIMSPNFVTSFATVLSVTVALTPIGIQIPQFIQNIPSAPHIACIVIGAFVQICSVQCSFLYLYLELYDLLRKVFMLDQCLYLISTKRTQCREYKMLPTIDLNKTEVIEAWSMLRSICFDYGAVYHLRSQSFYSIVFLGLVVAMVASINLILGYFVLPTEILVVCCELAGIFLYLISNYLLKAAYINDMFEKFTTQLENLKFTYQDLEKTRTGEPQNFIHKSFVQQESGDSKKIIDALDNAIRHNEYDSRNYCFKLYGLKITFNLLQTVVMALFTIYSFVVQQRMSNNGQ